MYKYQGIILYAVNTNNFSTHTHTKKTARHGSSYNPSTQEAVVGGAQVGGQPLLHSENLSINK
jgi:hypothetical protein